MLNFIKDWHFIQGNQPVMQRIPLSIFLIAELLLWFCVGNYTSVRKKAMIWKGKQTMLIQTANLFKFENGKQAKVFKL